MLTNAGRPLFVLLLCAVAVSAQPQSPQSPPAAGRILLDVVVTPKSGPPVRGLQQQDFTLLDNKAPQTITSFQAVDGRLAPLEVVLVIDAVNSGFQGVAFEREEIDNFLRTDGGHLAHPLALAFLTDTGMQVQQGFSTDGNALSASLDQFAVGLRSIRRSAGFYGATERYDISLKGLGEIAEHEAAHPGRKMILWVSPGWSLLSGPRIEIDYKQQQQLFSGVVNFSTQLRQAGITLYSIDPLGTADSGGRAFYWKEFVKGVSKPSQVEPANLALQVIATQSGGLAVNSSNDVAALLRQCMADANAYYEISFDPPQGDQAHEYHHLEVRVAKPGLTARTRDGYYSQP